jgi:predicted DCC family thiol-disulfide oxidoreductase YuxK
LAVILFYDGHCGFCHSAVKFVLKHDRRALFRFAPLQGELASRRLPAISPDTMVVETEDGNLLMRSSAWIFILDRLGGPWKLAARSLGLIPRPIRDLAYRIFAACRRRIFGRPDVTCPILPVELRKRFDA